MSPLAKKDTSPAGLTGVLAVAALAVVLVCVCAASLIGTSGGAIQPAPQSSARSSTTPTPQADAARPEGRLNEGQEWSLIGLMVVLPFVALVLFYKIIRRQPAQDAITWGADDWPRFKALSAKNRREKVKAELERVRQMVPSGAKATGLERDMLDAKSFAVQQLFFERDDWLVGPASLEKDSLNTAFDAVLRRGQEVFPVDVLYLPKACAVEAANKDELLTAWQQMTRDRVINLAFRLSEDGARLTVSPLLLVVTSDLLSKESKDDRKKFMGAVNNKLKDTIPLINARFYDLGKLREDFGPTESEETTTGNSGGGGQGGGSGGGSTGKSGGGGGTGGGSTSGGGGGGSTGGGGH